MRTADVDSTTVTSWPWPALPEGLAQPDTAAVVPSRPGEAMGRAEVRDEQAFAAVFHAEHDRAVRLAYLLAGDREVAEDAVAEAFARMYEKWRAGRVERVGAYVRRSVVNQVKNHRRSMARLRRHESRRRGDDRGTVVPTEQVAARETLDALLARLPYRQRAAVVLRYYEDLSEADTAEELGCRRGTVKSLVSRAMAALREAAADAGLDRTDVGLDHADTSGAG